MFVCSVLAAIGDHEPRVCLAGGTTPKRLYEILSTFPLVFEVPWYSVHWFFGDERFVPHSHENSNARMVTEAMFGKVPIGAAYMHLVPTSKATPEEAASAYEAELQKVYGAKELKPGRPLFDLTLLGIGDDGHTASLFPGTAALQETKRWTASVVGAKPEPRITLTYPALNSSHHVAILAAGAGKTAIVKRIKNREPVPASGIRPSGTLHWFLDKAAAGV